MRGYYFQTMDIRSTRAHVSQVLHTAAAITPHAPLVLVLPRYGDDVPNEDVLRSRHDLPRVPETILLSAMGASRIGSGASLFFNIPLILFLFAHARTADFAYFRASYLLPTAFVARLLGLSVVYETHRRPLSLQERWRDFLMSTVAHGFVVISAHMSEHYVRYGKPLLVAHDAVSLSRFGKNFSKIEARKKIGARDGEKLCVYAGTVSRLKGTHYIVEAALQLPDVRFLLVGNVVDIRKEDLPSNVTLTGKVEQGELPAYLGAADALLLPHPKTEYSQSPMKLFEYMASGVPIVSTRVPAVLEVLNDHNAFLVEADSASALAEGIRNLFGNEAQARAKAAQARIDVGAYSWEARGEKIAGFLKKLV